LLQMLYVATTACYRCLGRKQEALAYAIRFLNGIKQLQICLGGIWIRSEVIIQTLLEAERKDLFVELLDLIEAKGCRWLVAKRIAQSYGPLLAETRSKLNTMVVKDEPTQLRSAHQATSRQLYICPIAPSPRSSPSTASPPAPPSDPSPPAIASVTSRDQKRRAKLQRLREENLQLEQQATRMEKEIQTMLDQGVFHPKDTRDLVVILKS